MRTNDLQKQPHGLPQRFPSQRHDDRTKNVSENSLTEETPSELLMKLLTILVAAFFLQGNNQTRSFSWARVTLDQFSCTEDDTE